MHVEDAMRVGRDRLVSNEFAVLQALETLDELGEHALLVEIRYGQWGWIDHRGLQPAAHRGRGETSIKKGIRTRPLVRTHADAPVDQALRKLAVYPLLPLASRMNPSWMVCTLTIEDVHRAYGIPTANRPPHKNQRMSKLSDQT